MTEFNDIKRITQVLRKVPEKKLLIIDLANQIPIKSGMLDPKVLASRQKEIHLAVQEANAYGERTREAINALIEVRQKEDSDVGPGYDTAEE